MFSARIGKETDKTGSDKPEYVDQAVEKFKGFYKKNL